MFITTNTNLLIAAFRLGLGLFGALEVFWYCYHTTE